MDSGRFVLAVILMITVMVVTNILLPPPPPPAVDEAADSAALALPPESTTVSAVAPTVRDSAADPLALADPDSTADTTAAAPVAGARTIDVVSDLYRYDVSTAGGSIRQATLLQFASYADNEEGPPVTLSPGPESPLIDYRLRIGTREIALDELPFTTDATDTMTVGDGADRTLELRHNDPALSVIISYTFDPDRYVVDTRIGVRTADGQVPTLLIGLPHTLAIHEAQPQEDERSLAYVWNAEREGIGSVNLSKVEGERVENGPLLWTAVKNKYFAAAALTHPETQSRFGGIIARPIADEEHAADLTTTLLPGPDGTFAFRIFLGPQEPARLAELGNSFGDVNPFGWRAFRPILLPLGHAIQWALFGMHDLLQVGYGWVLILFGVLIRLVLWPLNASAMRSQMKNMEIQPKLKEIQARYKNEPEKLQKEMLRLYKEEGFNPMGGCLPMLIPLPILITLFFVFQSTIAFRGVDFLWLPDLSRADPLYILPVLLGVSMFLMQWLSSRSMTEVAPQMKFMMYAMPIFMTVLFLNFASGLNLYYAAMNFASIPQQLQISRERKRFQAEKAAAKT